MLAIIGYFVWVTAAIARAAAGASGERRWMLHGIAAFSIAILVTGVFEHNLADSEILMLALGLTTLGACLAADRDTIPV